MEGRQIHRAFESEGVTIAIDRLLPTKKLPPDVLKSSRYKEAEVSIREIGVIEPPMVCRTKDKSGYYLILDGHMRVQILKSQDYTEVFCLLSTDDEGFTYNRFINRLSPIQEHKMIMKAIDQGVSEKTLARTLGKDIRRIQAMRNLLNGICNEVVGMFKTRSIPAATFRIIKKMKPLRQIQVAELMVGANNYSITYAKAMLSLTPLDQLHMPPKARSEQNPPPEQIASIEMELMNLKSEYKLVEQSLGTDVLTMVAYRGYISHLFENSEVCEYLTQQYPEIFMELQKIVRTSATEPQLV